MEVWVLRVHDDGPLGYGAAMSGLTPPERDRATGFLVPEERRRFVVARAGLRALLGARLGVAPGDVPLVRRPTGQLVLPPGSPCFSVAHSGDLTAYVLAGRPVGIDVEVVGATPGDALLRRTCSRAEQRMLGHLAPARRRERFFELWVRKEAAVKASGGTAELARVRAWPGPFVRGPGLRGAWRAQGVELAPGYAAAVASRGVGWRLVPVRDLAAEELSRRRPHRDPGR